MSRVSCRWYQCRRHRVDGISVDGVGVDSIGVDSVGVGVCQSASRASQRVVPEYRNPECHIEVESHACLRSPVSIDISLRSYHLDPECLSSRALYHGHNTIATLPPGRSTFPLKGPSLAAGPTRLGLDRPGLANESLGLDGCGRHLHPRDGLVWDWRAGLRSRGLVWDW